MTGRLISSFPLDRRTSWRAGGTAKQAYQPSDIKDLQTFLATLPDREPLLWLGLGSNLLIRDKGFSGTVITTLKHLSKATWIEPNILRAEAGVTCTKLAKYCVNAGYQKGIFFAGIPGTLGGALAMNAGAYSSQTWELIEAVETIDRSGKLRIRSKRDFTIGYRHVICPSDEWFTAGYIYIPNTHTVAEAKQALKDLIRLRLNQQPIGTFSCGSVFRNPTNGYAGQLIESCGLKGKRVGGAHVSTKHANFIINDQGASATDIEHLIQTIQEAVAYKHAIQLVPEVKIIGNI